MSISLNDHENRIKVLETAVKWEQISDYKKLTTQWTLIGSIPQPTRIKAAYGVCFVEHGPVDQSINPRQVAIIPIGHYIDWCALDFVTGINQNTLTHEYIWMSIRNENGYSNLYAKTKTTNDLRPDLLTDNGIHSYWILTKYYFVRNNIIYKAKHFLEKIFMS